MKRAMKLHGIFISAATPFDYKGDLYEAKVEHNIDKWNQTAVSGYCVASSAGEGPLLSGDEKAALWQLTAKHAAPEKLLIADCTAEGVSSTIALAKCAALAGFHAIQCGVPHHYRSQIYGPDTPMLYFRSVADRSQLPVIIENAPGYTGVDLMPEVTAALSMHPNIAGVVEMGTPAERIAQIKRTAESRFEVLTGSPTALWQSLLHGASGAVLALASAVPYACITLWEAFRTRDQEAGIDWQSRIAHPGILATDLYGVPGLKHAMELNGYYGGPPRLPYCPPPPRAKREIEAAFRDLRG